MKYCIIIFILIISLCSYSKKIIELKNGESIKCEIISEENDILTVVSDTFGEMKINRSDIKLIKDLDERTGYRYDDPNHCSLLFMPSAETNPKGTWYVSDYELLFMNVGYSPIDDLHISTGFIFPIVPEMITEGPFSLGFKYRTMSEPYKMNMSVMGSYTAILEEADFGLITYGTAFNYYLSPRSTANLYFGGITTSKTGGKESIFSFGLALTFRTSESSKFIVEYLNGGMFDEIETNGIFIFGVRFFGERISADIAGVKFLDISGSEPWFFIPLLSLTYHF
ncbi:MAG TPA: hypothetical protein PLK90_01015 [Clostridiales bacterium]|nr:hypothetical protein [Clostridiales bacterium]HQP68957.1 hypothetical protein [Clostridiales bacterium]